MSSRVSALSHRAAAEETLRAIFPVQFLALGIPVFSVLSVKQILHARATWLLHCEINEWKTTAAPEPGGKT